MSWIQVVLISFATSLLAIAVIVLGLGGAWAHFGAHFGERWSAGARHERWTAWQGTSGRHAHGRGRICAADWHEHLEPVLRHAAAELRLTPAQRPAWTALTEALRSSAAALDAACRTTADAGDSLERLRRGEALLQAAHRALAKLRPRYAGFVAVLAPAQRARLEAWLAPRHAAFRRAEG